MMKFFQLNGTSLSLKMMPIKLRYASPPVVMVKRRMSLCSAMPRSMVRFSDARSMAKYISLSIRRKARVLSPTSAWSCDSA